MIQCSMHKSSTLEPRWRCRFQCPFLRCGNHISLLNRKVSGLGSKLLVRTCSQELDSVCCLHFPEGFRIYLAVQLAAVVRSTPSATAADAGQRAQDEHGGSHSARDWDEDAHQVVVLPPCYPRSEEVLVRLWLLYDFALRAYAVVEHGVSIVFRSVGNVGVRSDVGWSRQRSSLIVYR